MSRFTFVLLFLSCLNSFAQNTPIQVRGSAQGTFYAITYYDRLERDLKIEIDSVLNDFDRSLSTYKSYAVISQINSNKTTHTDSLFRVCFKKAKEINELTNGVFDPTVKPLMGMWKFESSSKNAFIDSAKVDSIMQFVGLDLITLRADTIYKLDDRVELDFNAFAQGYSVDVVASFLEQKGINSYLVEIGGEIKAGERKKNGKKWSVGIEKPEENQKGVNELFAIAKLEHLSVATSGNYRKFKVVNGRKYGHTINPKTGYPFIDPLLSVSVFSKECIDADALSTSLLAMGYQKALQFIKENQQIKCYLIYSDNAGQRKVYISETLKKIIVKQ